MEKYKCKICSRNFGNGRALGGHMRSHMLNLYVPPKTEQLGQETQSSDEEENQEQEEEEEEEEEDKGLLIYGLRENPKKSIRLVDHEFSFTAATYSVVVDQDMESETESSKCRQTIRRRSTRIRKSGISENQCVHDDNHGDYEYLEENLKKPKMINEKISNNLEGEAVSSISDTTTEEDVAYCLIMLSRDKWKRKKNEEKYIDVQYEDGSDRDEGIKVSKIGSRARAKYRCETCGKVFRSYQALGGHRASHKKVKFMNTREQISMAETEKNAGGSAMAVEEKRHECPVCFRVFASGQALGGHKRTHVIASFSSSAAANTKSTSTNSAKPLNKNGETTLIDLNLPAPVDDDDDDLNLSAVSDSEFVHPVKR